MADEKDRDNEILEFIKGICYEQIKISYGARVEKGTEWNLTKHSHNIMEIIYLTEAYAFIEGTNQKIKSTWCDVVIYPAGVEHREYVDINSNQKCIYIWIKIESKKELKEVFTVKDMNGKIYWLINELVDLAGEKELSKQDLARAYARGLFENIKENMAKEKEKIDLVDRVIQYIHHHYMEDLSIEKIAKNFYVNPSYLSRLFKKRMHMSPIQYLIEIRIEKAKKLLIATDMSMSEVCECVGILDNKYFSRVFKKHTNYTPTAFKKSQKNPILNK